jgi:hypothetical protein
MSKSRTQVTILGCEGGLIMNNWNKTDWFEEWLKLARGGDTQ